MHNKAVKASFWIFILFCCNYSSGPLYAQLSTADVVGTVADSTSAVIPGATVTLTNSATKVHASATASSSGDFLFTFLNPGKYTLSVTAPGFRNTLISSFTLAAGDRARENVTMQPGSANETVEVTADAPLLQRESSSISSVVTEQSVQDLPLNARNFVNLVQIQPGVNAGSPNSISSGNRPDDRRPSSTISANGQSDQFNNQLIDGADNNEILQGLITVRPSVDAIAEVKVDTNSFTAEVGRDAGAVVNLITKSGTNAVHGSLYEYFRNDIFNARDFFATTGIVEKPEYRQNQFGGSVGGPIVKDKTFFFADVEDSRVVRGLSSGLLTVPTLFEEQNPGNFSDVGGPNVPSSALNPTGLAYFKLFPVPNVPGAGAVNNYTNIVKQTNYTITADGRVDQHFRNGDTLYGRYSYNGTDFDLPGYFPAVSENGVTISPNGAFLSFAGKSKQSAHNGLLNYIHVFNQNTILELKSGYTRVNFATGNLNEGVNADTALGVQDGNIPSLTGTTGLTPLDFLSGGYGTLGDSPYLPIVNVQNSFFYAGSLTYVRGKHNLHAGGQLLQRQLNYFQSSFPIGFLLYAGITGNSAEDLLTGLNIGYERGNTLQRPGFRRLEPSGYIQDDWRATPSLTLNLGIRYDVFTPFSEVHNRYANFDYPNRTLITGATDPHIGLRASHANFAPRIGFSQSIGQKTVVRGGYGISYYPAQISLSILLNNPPNVFQSTCIGVACIGAPLPLPTAPSTSNLSGSLTYAPSNLNTSSIQMTNFAVQQEFKNNVFTLAYVGEFGRHQLFQPTVNIPDPDGPYPGAVAKGPSAPPAFTTAAQLPNVGPVQGYLPVAASSYNALQAIVARRLHRGLIVNANYTLAHGLSDGSSGTGELGSGQGLIATNPDYDYGNAANDVRSRLAFSSTYELPLGQNAHGVRAILQKGWSANVIGFWQTGLPYTVVSSVTNLNGLAQINLPTVTTDRPDATGARLNVSHPSLSHAFNTTAFTPQPAGVAGNEHFNQLYGPHQRSADLSFFKTTQLRGETSLQFRAECFNISNTPNFFVSASGATITAYQAGPEHGPSNSLAAVGPLPGDIPTSAGGFGQISSTTPGSNPRQFQFALKLLF
jgi:hypothetical protein